MPKSTFLNLSKEKRNNIIEAARKEFSRVVFSKASINKIIKDLDISRGSFYTYFDNIEDLYFYLLCEYRDGLIDKTKQAFIKSKGDIIEAYIDIFDYLVEEVTIDSNKHFFINMFSDMNYKMETFILPKPDPSMLCHELLNVIDIKKLNINNNMEVLDIFDIVMTLTMRSIVQIVVMKIPISIIKDRYINQLNILKRGIYKEDE
jgi:AcrR family transcriptional regulator